MISKAMTTLSLALSLESDSKFVGDIRNDLMHELAGWAGNNGISLETAIRLDSAAKLWIYQASVSACMRDIEMGIHELCEHAKGASNAD